jgi:pimeloyl-ACP methyl ester carboxylesterase
MKVVEANETRLSFVDTGYVSGGRTVVALHSLGADNRLWLDQIAYLAPYVRVIAPDSRGHGQSGWNGSVTLEDWVADIEAVLEEAGADTIDLIGVSMGGLQVMAYAGRYPERVGALVLADSFSHLAEEVAESKVEGTAGAAQQMGMQRYAEHYVSETLTNLANEDGAENLREAIASMPLEAYVSSVHACFYADTREALAEVRSPTLVLWGERDEKVPRALSEEVAELVRDSEFKTVPAAGHLSNLDNPAAFNEILREFLKLPIESPRETS